MSMARSVFIAWSSPLHWLGRLLEETLSLTLDMADCSLRFASSRFVSLIRLDELT